MAVLVTMQVGPVDWEKFRSALEWLNTQNLPGRISSKIYRAEGAPSTVLWVEEWETHDAFHAVADQLGSEFVARSATEELDWQDNVWVLSHTAADRT